MGDNPETRVYYQESKGGGICSTMTQNRDLYGDKRSPSPVRDERPLPPEVEPH